MTRQETHLWQGSREGAAAARTATERNVAAAPEIDAIPLPIELLTPLRDVELELVILIRGYGACIESRDSFGRVVRNAARLWPHEARENKVPPSYTYWVTIADDLREVKLDDLHRVVRRLPQLESDDEAPEAIVDTIDAVLTELRTEVEAGPPDDPQSAYQRAWSLETKVSQAERRVANLAGAIRERAEARGWAIQNALSEIFRMIDKRQREAASMRRPEPDQHRPTTRPAMTLRDTLKSTHIGGKHEHGRR